MYKPRRERKRAAGGPAGMEHHGAPHMIMVIGIAPKKKPRKRGGHVEGEAAKHHLGRRARGGKALDARQAANDPDGVDLVNEGMGTDERAYPVRRRGGRAHRADGGPAIRLGSVQDYALHDKPLFNTLPVVSRRSNGTMDDTDTERLNANNMNDALMQRYGAKTAAQGARPLFRDNAAFEKALAGKARGGRAEGPHGLGRGTHEFRTPSGSVSANARREAEKHHDAMPGGRFPIEDRADLDRAKHAFGRAKDKPAVRRWIDEKAREMGEPPLGGKVGRK